MTSLSLIFPLVDQWHQLRDGTRDAIIGGLVVALIVGVATVFHKTLLSGLRRLVGADGQPAPPQVIVNARGRMFIVPSDSKIHKLL